MDRHTIPPIAWRPTPRSASDLTRAAEAAAGAWLVTLVEPSLGAAGLGAAGLWTAGRFWRSSQLTQQCRAGWKRNAYAGITPFIRMPKPDGWGDPVDDFVKVYPENWVAAGPAQPPAPQYGWKPTWREWRLYRHRQRLEGLRIIPQRVYLTIPPWAVIDWRRFRRHWNEIQGYPGTTEHPVDPWRWVKDRGHLRIIGEPFSLPSVVPFPEGFWSLDQFRLGILEDGTELVWDLTMQPHALTGAGTGAGKTGEIRMVAYQAIMGALWANLQPGVGIMDPKGDQFTMFEGLPWNRNTCEGVHVAWDDLDPNGELVSLTNMERLARAFRQELGRRRRQSRVFQRARLAGQRLPAPIWRPIFLMVDELAELLEREQVAKGDDSPAAQAARTRNMERGSIERSLRVILRLGRDLRIHVLAAAQSPRAEFLPMDAKANLGFLLYLGMGSPTELGIIFGKDLPDSPTARPGMGVWRDSREGVDPADPYLYLKLYWMDPELIWERLDPLRVPEPDSDPSRMAA